MLARDGVIDDIVEGRAIVYEPARRLNEPGPPPQPLVIEPPPWAGQPPVDLPTVDEADPPGALHARALDELKAADDRWDPPPPGPPLQLAPLERFTPPPWPEEERRAEQLARERAQLGIDEEQPQRHPPPRREPA